MADERREVSKPPAADAAGGFGVSASPDPAAPRSTDTGLLRPEIRRWVLRGASLTVGVAIIVGLILLASAAVKAVILVFLAVLLGAGLQPVVEQVRSRIGIGRVPAILLVYAAFFVAVIAFALFVVPASLSQAERTIAELPDLLAELRVAAESLRPAALSTSLTALIDAAERAVTPAAPNPDDVVEIGIGAIDFVVTIAALLAIVFFWLTEHARLERYALAFLPQERRAGARDAWNRIETRLGLWVRGQLILMTSIGLATGIAYSVLGLPAAIMLALIAAICEAIPIIGPLLGAVPAVLVAATVSPELAIIVAIIYLIIQFVEGNVLVPIVMRNTIGLSPFVVLVSLLIGATAAGILGALIAVPIAATIEVVLEGLQAREVPVAPDPVAKPGNATEAEATEADALAEAIDSPAHRADGASTAEVAGH